MTERKRKYRVYGRVVGTKFLGEYEAATPDEARKMALESDEAWVSLCHQCSDECEEAEIDDVDVEPSDD